MRRAKLVWRTSRFLPWRDCYGLDKAIRALAGNARRALFGIKLDIVMTGSGVFDPLVTQLRSLGVNVLCWDEPIREVYVIRVELLRGSYGHLIPAGCDPLLDPVLKVIAPVGIDGAARLVLGVVPLGGVRIENHGPAGKRFVSHHDVPLDLGQVGVFLGTAGRRHRE